MLQRYGPLLFASIAGVISGHYIFKPFIEESLNNNKDELIPSPKITEGAASISSESPSPQESDRPSN
ncbi:hypothetical protein DSO57_1020827 [Entomophthora muscae]|uniref:Uncharacterized protein n=1 Tax=Entomophthora muscae TaxID=34485 RepID=A0ACC2TEP5_9FUNG|nr:hypothetical protein DSO57_1020827 [Entomophthora muscae]